MEWQIYEDEFLSAQAVKHAEVFSGNGIVAVRYLSVNDNHYALRIIKRVPVRRYD